MLRFVLRRKVLDRCSGADYSTLETIDIDVPSLEALLHRGGFDQEAHDFTVLVGVEVLPTAASSYQREQEGGRG